MLEHPVPVPRVPDFDDGRQPRVGEARQERAAVLLQVPEVLRHLGGTGRAVEAEDVGSHRFERGDCGTDLRADEHPPRRLHRHLHHQRDGAARVAHRPAARDDRGLGLEQVVDGLDEQHVGAPFEQPRGLDLVVVAQRRERDRAERGQPGAGPDGADHEPGALRRRELGRDLLGDARRGDVEVERDVRDAVLGEDQPEGAEGRGLDRVDTRLEVLAVHPGDQVGPGEHEVLVAPLELGTAEVVRAEVLRLHPGAERAVEQEHARFEGAEEVCHQTGEITAHSRRSPLDSSDEDHEPPENFGKYDAAS